MTPDKLFTQASELEGTNPQAALQLYLRIAETPAIAGHFLFPMHINAGIILYHMSRFDEAEKHFRRSLEVDPKSPIAHYNLASVLDETKRPEEAVEAYKAAIKLKPDFADAHYNLGFAYANTLQKPHKAFHHFQKYLKLNQEGAWAKHARNFIDQVKAKSGIKVVSNNLEPRSNGSRARLALVSDETL